MCVHLLLFIRAEAGSEYPHFKRAFAGAFAHACSFSFNVCVSVCESVNVQHALNYFTLFHTADQSKRIAAMAPLSLWGDVLVMRWLSEEFQALLASCLSFLWLSVLHMKNGRIKRKGDIQSIRHYQGGHANTWCMGFSALQHCCIAQVRGVSTHTHTFPLLDIPKGELIPSETVAINEVGMTVE